MRLSKHFWFRLQSGDAGEWRNGIPPGGDGLMICPDFWKPCPEKREIIHLLDRIAAGSRPAGVMEIICRAPW